MQEPSGQGLVAQLRKVWNITKDRRLVKAWFVLLLLFTAGVGALTLPGHASAPSYVALAFYAFVPGYSFVQSIMRRTSMFEKFFTSIFFSIAFLTGTKALDRTISLQTGGGIAFLPSSPLEFGLVFSLTTILLVYDAWVAFGLPNLASKTFGRKGTNSNPGT